MILDEVQTGMGRTGKMFAYQNYGIEPDLMTLAKSLGGGISIGALVVNKKIENCLTPGTHASTFGGNPLATAAALAVFKTIKKEKLIKNVEVMGQYLREHLEKLQVKYACIKNIRGLGIMLGMECDGDIAPKIVMLAMQKGLLINCTQGNILRIVPAINVTKKMIDKAMIILGESIAELI